MPGAFEYDGEHATTESASEWRENAGSWCLYSLQKQQSVVRLVFVCGEQIPSEWED